MVARQMYIEDPPSPRLRGAGPPRSEQEGSTEPEAVPVPRSAAIALVIITVAVIALGYPKPWLALGQAAARALF